MPSTKFNKIVQKAFDDTVANFAAAQNISLSEAEARLTRHAVQRAKQKRSTNPYVFELGRCLLYRALRIDARSAVKRGLTSQVNDLAE